MATMRQGVICPVCGRGFADREPAWHVSLPGWWPTVHRGECQEVLEASIRVARGWVASGRGRRKSSGMAQRRLEL